MNRLELLRRYLLLICFAGFVWGFSLWDMLTPPGTFSEMENRPLTGRPAFSARSLFNNSYTLRYEQYTNDQFAGRDGWITLKSLGESALLKLENNGVIYGEEDYLFEKQMAFDRSQLEKNLGFIAEYSRIYMDTDITVSIIPASYAILDDLLPKGAPVVDQISEIEWSYQLLSDAPLRVLDLTNALCSHSGEYIYYRTDHHWTTLGAYYACNAYLKMLEMEPLRLPDWAAYEVPGFYGSHYSKAKNWNAVPDIITWYDFKNPTVIVDGELVIGIYDREQFEKRDKYAAFLHGNNGLTIIRSEQGSNGTSISRFETEPSRVLLVKDSYGNSLAPFLAARFDEVHVADLRYFPDFPALMREYDYDEVYILYSFANLAEDSNLFKLATR